MVLDDRKLTVYKITRLELKRMGDRNRPKQIKSTARCNRHVYMRGTEIPAKGYHHESKLAI